MDDHYDTPGHYILRNMDGEAVKAWYGSPAQSFEVKGDERPRKTMESVRGFIVCVLTDHHLDPQRLTWKKEFLVERCTKEEFDLFEAFEMG